MWIGNVCVLVSFMNEVEWSGVFLKVGAAFVLPPFQMTRRNELALVSRTTQVCFNHRQAPR